MYIYICFQQQQQKFSLFFNIRTTRFDQSSPVQPNPGKKDLEKSGKISENQFKKKMKEKMVYSQFSILGGCDLTRAL